MRQISLASGSKIDVMGVGTWRLGESSSAAAREVGALRAALEVGFRLFDTAEMYGEGGAESVLGQALRGALREDVIEREHVFIVSKVYPHNASRVGIARACDASRRRLGLDRIDLYLLHWPGEHPLAETIEGFEAEQARGAIGAWGVSNFDVEDLRELWRAEHSTPQTTRCALNQIYYSLATRGAEFSLSGLMQAARMPLMAYTPIDRTKLASSPELARLAHARGASVAQMALAWLASRPNVCAIPKAASRAHLEENFHAAEFVLCEAELAALDTIFPPPQGKRPLEMV